MKKVFNKISKIMFAAGIAGLLGLLIIVSSVQEIVGAAAVAVLICILAIMGMVLFSVICFVFAMMEGLKKDKKAFITRFAVQVIVMLILYAGAAFFDKTKEFNLLESLLRSAALSVGIIGGEYMISKHEDKDAFEL